MSYPLDPVAQDAALDALLSRDLSGIPASWEVALWDGDPRVVGTAELGPDGGYVRPVIANDATAFPAASAGQKVAAVVAFADPTGAWSSTARFWVLVDHADSVTRWFFGPLVEEVAVVGGETGISIQPETYWNTEGI